MTAHRMPAERDPIGRVDAAPVTITVDGEMLSGSASTIGGILLENGRDSWRTSSRDRRPRGIFCGIGVCYDCILTVNGERDVRACQRCACEGDVVELQSEARSDAAEAAAREDGGAE